MGLFSGLLGNAGEVDIAEVEQELASIMADGEKPEQVFKLIRDLIVFTNRRLILIDKQGLTGSKKEYMSIPYRSIVRFAAETKGHFDLESDLKIWLSSTDQPISKTFSKDSNIMSVQKALATYICR
ncbi:MAG: PH domain-containing protein [Rheinheimera sp.]